jgi:cytoskeleton protein RodZ
MDQMENTVGQQLKRAREALGIQLRDAALATHIKLVYLQELENDHPELLPSPGSARGFLRLYAAYLKLPTAELIDRWDHPVLPQTAPTAEAETPAAPSTPIEDQAGNTAEQSTPAAVEPSLPEAEQTTPVEPVSPLSELHAPPLPEKKKRSRRKKVEPDAVETAASLARPDDSPEPVIAQKNIEESPSKVQDSSEPAQTTTPAPLPLKSSAELFLELGGLLRERRELLGLTLADIERFTHIKRPFLEALENGQFSQLPSSVQGRGMLNNYAAFLSLEESAVMSTYAAALEAQRQERLPPRKPEPVVSGGIRINIPPRLKKYLSPDLIFGSLVILAMFFFLLWSAVQVFTGQNADLTPTAPSISEVLQVSPTPIPEADLTLTAQVTVAPAETSLPGAGLSAAPAAPTAVATRDNAPVQVYVVALQRAYLQVSVDGKVVFDGRVVPGGAYTYSAQKSVDLLTGSAAAIEVYFNQKFQGRLGEVGQVIKLTFTETGLSAPAPTQTPLVTPTPTPTDTPIVTPTAR